MAIILDGKSVQEKKRPQLQKEFEALASKASLLVIQVGNNSQSDKYIARKKIFGESIGVVVTHHTFPEHISFEELSAEIVRANIDPTITGIIVQLPLPAHLDQHVVIDSIDPLKDVDGLTSVNTNALRDNKTGIVPATARGVIEILEAYDIAIEGSRVVIIGRGPLVGKPAFFCFSNRGAIVTVCHRETKNLSEETKRADILVVAAGVRDLITKDFVREGQTIIDVGLTAFEEDSKMKLRGDVDFDGVVDIVGAITPSPGGIGPMTILCLFENLLKAYQLQHIKK